MDVQKISPLANTATGTKQQGSGNLLDNVSALASSFANMIRVPTMSANALFAGSDRDARDTNQVANTQKQSQAPERKEADNKDYRVDNSDRPANDRDNTQDRVEARQDDSYSSDERNETSEQNYDDAKDTPVSRDDNQKSASTDDQTSDGDEAAENADAASSDQSGNENTNDSEVSISENANAMASNAGSNAEGFNAALEGLVIAAQNNTGEQSVKAATQVLTEVVNGPVENTNNANAAASLAGKPVEVAAQNSGPQNNAAGQQINPGDTPEEIINNPQAQKVLRAVARMGLGTTPADLAQAAKAAEVPLSEQQARMLSDQLKSDRPVNINVTVNNRAEVAVSQTSQSLSSNAVAAQAADNGSVINKDNSPALTRPGTSQVAGNGAENQAATQGQAQATTQLAEVAANANAERGIARATTQVTSSAPQSGVDASSATTQSANTQAQQTASAQKPQQVQTPNTPEQARPLSHQISVNITKAIADGLDRITIQLRPDNLGRVEVQLEVSSNGKVSATIIADRPEALELLRNDARNLERTLQEAGFDTTDLDFNLRDQNENSGESQPDSQMADADAEGDVEEEMPDGTPEAELATRLLNGELDSLLSETHVDIHA